MYFLSSCLILYHVVKMNIDLKAGDYGYAVPEPHGEISNASLEKCKTALLEYLKDSSKPRNRSHSQIDKNFETRFSTKAIDGAVKALVDEDLISERRNAVGSERRDDWYSFINVMRPMSYK